MIYEVRSRLFFLTQPEAEKALKFILITLETAVTVHPDEPNQQGSSVELIKCFHDQTPTKPCTILDIMKGV